MDPILHPPTGIIFRGPRPVTFLDWQEGSICDREVAVATASGENGICKNVHKEEQRT